jgi:hypothetical protein
MAGMTAHPTTPPLVLRRLSPADDLAGAADHLARYMSMAVEET